MHKTICATFRGKLVESVEKIAATALEKQRERKIKLGNDQIRRHRPAVKTGKSRHALRTAHQRLPHDIQGKVQAKSRQSPIKLFFKKLLKK